MEGFTGLLRIGQYYSFDSCLNNATLIERGQISII
jgi:hypothetical protein